MPKTKLFMDNTLAAGVKSQKDIIKFEFVLNQGITGDQIEYLVPDCGSCTKAQLIGDKVVGSVDLSKAFSQYNDGKTPVTKTVYVYVNDGKPRFIGKPVTKEVQVNPEKEFERLTIACVVDKK